MTKILRVALHEYKRHVFNKRFLMGLLSVPLVMLVMVGLIVIIIAMETNYAPVGYVDHSGLLANPVSGPVPEKPDKPITMLAFETEAEAQIALQAGDIQAYYVLPADYMSTGSVTLVENGDFKSTGREQFYDFLSANLLRDTDPAIANRIMEGVDVITVSPDGGRSASEQTFINILLPMLAGIAFVIAMFSTGGYLMQAVVEEKENRTMEVIVTSVSPNQFMAGKIIGDISIGLTQILTWSLFIVVPVLVGSNYVDFLHGIKIQPQTIFLLVFVMFPSFITVSALMAAVGATVSEAREGQQMTGLIGMPIWIPYMLMAVIMQNPNAPLVVVLSMIPLTAPLTMLMRDGFAILPTWQIVLSAFIQIAAAAGSIWLAGRAFRLGMLLYGKRLKWREIFRRQGARP